MVNQYKLTQKLTVCNIKIKLYNIEYLFKALK